MADYNRYSTFKRFYYYPFSEGDYICTEGPEPLIDCKLIIMYVNSVLYMYNHLLLNNLHDHECIDIEESGLLKGPIDVVNT